MINNKYYLQRGYLFIDFVNRGLDTSVKKIVLKTVSRSVRQFDVLDLLIY